MTQGPLRTPVLAIMAVVALVGAACGDDEAPAGARTGAEQAVFADEGPYDVGVTTLDLPDRQVEVFYPAAAGSTDGRPLDSYEQDDPIPPELAAALPPIPPDVELTQEIPAVRDAPVSGDGPFPLVLFSHGASGWRGINSIPLSGLASWGMIVASTDYLEYGLVAQVTNVDGGEEPTEEDRRARRAEGVRVAEQTIELMATEDATPGGRFEGAIDLDLVGGVGHSAGGGTMFGLLDDERVGVIVGWAPVPPQAPVTSDTPTLIVAAAEDTAITEEQARESFGELRPPKRLVVVEGMGHNGFSDICLPVRSGNDLLGVAERIGLSIPERLLELGRNGCEPDSLDIETGWSITQHFTVAALRDGLGIDSSPVGLSQAAADAFDDATVTYEEQLP